MPWLIARLLCLIVGHSTRPLSTDDRTWACDLCAKQGTVGGGSEEVP
jgi:hypothetical protein